MTGFELSLGGSGLLGMPALPALRLPQDWGLRQGGATSPGIRAHLAVSTCLPWVLGRPKGRDVLGGQVPSPQPRPTGLWSLLQVVTAETLLDLSDASEHDEGNEVSKAPHGHPWL